MSLFWIIYLAIAFVSWIWIARTLFIFVDKEFSNLTTNSGDVIFCVGWGILAGFMWPVFVPFTYIVTADTGSDSQTSLVEPFKKLMKIKKENKNVKG